MYLAKDSKDRDWIINVVFTILSIATVPLLDLGEQSFFSANPLGKVVFQFYLGITYQGSALRMHDQVL